MTPILLILMKAFWFYGRFSEAMSFSKYATPVSKVTIDVPKISIVLLPQVSALALKSEDSMSKEKHSLRTLQCYNPWEATLYLNHDFWYKKANFENDIASGKWL